jgi:hypothetical protein
MQRRTVGKSQAHISLPKDSLSRMGGQDSEKPSRLNRRNLGVTNRIWIILSLVLSILLLTRYIIGSSSAPSAGGHRLLSSDLKPKNYLNATDLQHRESPFAFCPVYGEGDEVSKKYGALALTKTKLYLGSGARIQRVVNKAMSGLPVTISVIGGSGMFCLVSRFRAPKLHPPWHPLSGVVPHVCGFTFGGSWASGLGLFFLVPSVQTYLTDLVRVSVCSVSLSWRWNGPSIAKLLPIQVLPVVERRLPASRLGTHKWGNEAHQLGLLLLLQFPPHTRRDGLDHHRAGYR